MSVLGGEDAPFLVLTGPTGGGKSLLADWLAQRGAFVLDADRIGHELLLDPSIRDRVVERFGVRLLDAVSERLQQPAGTGGGDDAVRVRLAVARRACRGQGQGTAAAR